MIQIFIERLSLMIHICIERLSLMSWKQEGSGLSAHLVISVKFKYGSLKFIHSTKYKNSI